MTTKKTKNELYDKGERLKYLLWTRAEKIEEQAEALRKEAAQIEYILRDFYKLAKDDEVI